MRNLILSAADLLSDDAENVEYDRGVIEIVTYAVGLTSDDFDAVHALLRAVKP